MMAFERYNRILLLPVAACFVLLFYFAGILEPLSGDLTRLGAYREKDFGWNDPQKRFSQPHYNLEKQLGYDQPYDVVVVGDSFSIKEFPFQWQSYLAIKTGWNILTVPVDKVDAEQLIEHPTFQSHPPKLVVLQIVERSLTAWLGTGALERQDCSISPSQPTTVLDFHPQPVNPVPYWRNRKVGWLSPNFSESAHYIKGSVKRGYDLNIKSRFGSLPQSVRLPLNRTGLFSSRIQNSILLYRNDFWKQKTPENLQRIRCGLAYWQRLVQLNGKTRFVALIAPDKSTAYAPYIDFGGLESVNLIDSFSDEGLNVVNLKPPLRELIQNGVRDVYLPDDTHWGHAGHEQAAQSLVEYLKSYETVSRKD